MKYMKLKTVIVIGLVFGLLCGACISAFKVGTDGTGQRWGWINNDDGYITTSSGKAYPATGIGLQNAVWSFNGTGLGGTVYLPNGSIHLDRTIKISHIGITIQGVGWDASFLYLDAGINKDGIQVYSATGADTAMWITLRDFTIDGERASNTKGTGINITLSDNGYIENVYSEGWAKHGIWLNSQSEVWTINNVHVYNNGVDGVHISGDCGDNKLFAVSAYSNLRDGLNIAGIDNNLYSCKAYANGEDGIQVEGDLNILIDCGAWSNGQHGFYVTDKAQIIGATKITASRSANNDGSGFYLWSKEVVLTSCFAYDSGAGYTQEYGLQIQAGSTNTIISSCNFSGSIGNAIFAPYNISNTMLQGSYLGVVLPKVAPSIPVAGSCWFNSTRKSLDIYNGASWNKDSYGTCAIAGLGTSIVVNHNLSATPKIVICNPMRTMAGTASYWYVDTFTATQFTVHTDAAIGATAVEFSWYARV